MWTNLSLQLFSGFAGVIVGVVIGYFSQRKLIGMQIAAANESNEKLLRRIQEQIDLQIKAAEVSAIGNLFAFRQHTIGSLRSKRSNRV